ncbi:hypothetical protein BT96DRAFT_935391 [Gymnopus androsaceus JB14]|uniref:Uncharacterized protein n=1 Tax=Gymnopus androsaceus JB14 TaxID=1447944 RepID=A0A6A4I466_9AGAR|nr:hypothetical protein BT96DRAFT_935391 [Gymnopus androsaceus JB14]
MTPSEVQLSTELGSDIFFNIMEFTILWVLYGIFIGSATMAFYLLLKKGATGYTHKAILICMILLVLANTWNFILVSGGPVIQVNSALIYTSSQGLEGQIAASNEITLPWDAQITWPGTITLMLSDGIVTWRACAIWPHAKILRLVLSGLMIANIGVNLTATMIIGLKVWYDSRI